jgi:hypothetical protein
LNIVIKIMAQSAARIILQTGDMTIIHPGGISPKGLVI